MFVVQTKTYTTIRTVKSVLIVTRMGYVEGVFTSFRALANSQGATRINIEGEYESYTEPELTVRHLPTSARNAEYQQEP